MNYSYDRFYKLFEITFSGARNGYEAEKLAAGEDFREGWDGPWNYGKGRCDSLAMWARTIQKSKPRLIEDPRAWVQLLEAVADSYGRTVTECLELGCTHYATGAASAHLDFLNLVSEFVKPNRP